MNEADIENAIKARISAASLSWPIAWPNQDVPDPKPQPRLEVNIDRIDRRSPTLGPSLVISRGFVRVNCIVKVGSSTATVNAKAQEVANLFPKAATLQTVGGRVIFTDAADIRAGFRNGSEWVVPVIAPYNVIPA